MFSVFAATFALLVSAQSAFAQCARSYTVVSGDICDSISAANNVSTYQLAALNSAIDAGCDNLMPDEVLCLGNGDSTDCSSTYVVQANDDCDIVSGKFGSNSSILMLNNPQIASDCSNLYIGEVLCVAQSVQVPAAPATPVATSIPTTATPAIASSTDAASTTPVTVALPTTDSASASLTTFTITPTSDASSAEATSTADSSDDGDDGDDTDGDDGDDSQLPFCDEL